MYLRAPEEEVWQIEEIAAAAEEEVWQIQENADREEPEPEPDSEPHSASDSTSEDDDHEQRVSIRRGPYDRSVKPAKMPSQPKPGTALTPVVCLPSTLSRGGNKAACTADLTLSTILVSPLPAARLELAHKLLKVT